MKYTVAENRKGFILTSDANVYIHNSMKIHQKRAIQNKPNWKKRTRKCSTNGKNVNFLVQYTGVMIPQTILCLSINHNYDFCTIIVKVMIPEMMPTSFEALPLWFNRLHNWGDDSTDDLMKSCKIKALIPYTYRTCCWFLEAWVNQGYDSPSK